METDIGKTESIRCHWGLLVALVVSGGCGSDQLSTYPVRGTVHFADGKPVTSGVVEFESIEHEVTATGSINPDGSFVLGTYESDDGAVLGKHRGIVVQMIVNDGSIHHSQHHGQAVDPLYGSYDMSGLEVNINPIKLNTIELRVTAAKQRH